MLACAATWTDRDHLRIICEDAEMRAMAVVEVSGSVSPPSTKLDRRAVAVMTARMAVTALLKKIEEIEADASQP